MESRTVGGTTKQVEVCDIDGSREKVSIGPFLAKNPNLLMDQKVYSRSQQAPSVTGTVSIGDNNIAWPVNVRR